jgi:hypothetical protein
LRPLIVYTGFIGIFTMLVLWVPIPVLHYAKMEIAGLPENPIAWIVVSINAGCSFAYNALFMLSIALTSPVFASVAVGVTGEDSHVIFL